MMMSRPYLAYPSLLTQAYHTGSPEAAHSPVHGGIAVYVNIPNYGSRHIGTLSGVVIDRSTKKRYLISNQHVFFPGAAGGKTGLSVYMTGSNQPIAKTYRTKGEKNPWPAGKKQEALNSIGTYHDSALATALMPVSMNVNNIGVQRSSVPPKKGMRIKFFGRASRLQRGVIVTTSTSAVSDAGGGRIHVAKDIIGADIASKPGDSGSMVFTEDNHVVGLLFGGATGPLTSGRTYICKAAAIERAYNVAFSEEEVGGGGAQPQPQPQPQPTPVPVPRFQFPQLDLKNQGHVFLVVLGGVLVVGLMASAAASGGRE